MKTQSSIFGWKAAFKNYGLNSFWKDSILPLIVAFTLSILMYRTNADVLFQLKVLVDIGISIVPAMVALILTAYTIMLTFITGDKFSSIKHTDGGKRLIEDLNSSFAACLFVSTISIIMLIVVSSIANLGIQIENPNIVNYPIYISVCYLLVFSVSILIGIVVDIFNCGQTTILDSKDNK